jgi:Protein of unknown function (DUF3145)
MSDASTYLHVVIHAAPGGQHEPILEVLRAYGMYDERFCRRLATLTLGEQYDNDTSQVGAARRMADALVKVAPAASFEVWERPNSQWLGTVVRHTPELGRFEGTCDIDGAVQLDSAAVALLLDQVEGANAKAAVGQVREAVAAATGQLWLEAFGQLRGAEEADR